MSSLGIYFGPEIISIVETKGRKPLNHTQIPQSIIAAGELEEKVTAEVKAIEIIAIFKEELRRNKIEAKEVTLCLSGRDLIIRTFEIPVLPREELQSAIHFEAKKYIPFKVEDLVFDFQLKFDKVSRTNLILFMGIKKETLDKYISIVSQLNIKINAIEYSAFSVLRCLKLAGLSDNGIIGILVADIQGKDEVNFIVLENGFPLFSRDIALTGEPEGLRKIEETVPTQVLEKLKTEIRVSLDYYHRKFPTKNIKEIFLFSNQDCRLDLEAFITEIGLSVRYVDVARYINRSIPYSLVFIKSYCSSLSKIIKSNIKVNLLAAKEKVKALKEKVVQKEAVFLFKGLKFNNNMVALGLLICIATFSFGLFRIQSLRKELNSIIGMRTQVAPVNPEATYEELAKINSEYERKLDTLVNLRKKQLYLTEPLDVIPRALPRGVWLNSFNFYKKGEEKAELVLEGTVYLADSDKEFNTVNKLISNLKENPDFIKYFKEISITSLDRKQLERFTVTNFFISCKTYQERE